MSVRIQFDLDDGEYESLRPYILNDKLRHLMAHQAFLEWRNRKEGRDVKKRKEQLLADKKILAPILEELIENKESK